MADETSAASDTDEPPEFCAVAVADEVARRAITFLARQPGVTRRMTGAAWRAWTARRDEMERFEDPAYMPWENADPLIRRSDIGRNLHDAMHAATKGYDGDDLEAALSAAFASIPDDEEDYAGRLIQSQAARLLGDALELASSLSRAERQALADKGQALADLSYPIPDKAHLHAAAAVLAASGHGNVKAARKLIRKRARELGVDLASLPGFGGSSGGNDHDADDRSHSVSAAGRAVLDAARDGTSRFALSEIERLSQVQLAQQRHPVTGRFISQGRGVPQPAETTDADPSFDVEAEIERLVANSPELFRSPNAGRHQGRNQADFRSSYGPPSPSTFGQRARALAR